MHTRENTMTHPQPTDQERGAALNFYLVRTGINPDAGQRRLEGQGLTVDQAHASYVKVHRYAADHPSFDVPEDYRPRELSRPVL